MSHLIGRLVSILCTASISSLLIGDKAASSDRQADVRPASRNPVTFAGASAEPHMLHPFSMEDVLLRRSIVEVSPSSVPQLIAVTISRPAMHGETYVADNRMLDDNAGGRTDLFVLNGVTGEVAFAPNTPSVRAAYGPTWSPDGRKLAFLTIDQERKTSLRIWKPGSRRATAFALPTVRRGIPLRGADGQVRDTGIVWIDDEHVAALAARAAPDQLTKLGNAWRATWRGQLSVRVWRSTATPSCRPDDTLVAISSRTGKIRHLADGPIKGAAFLASHREAIVLTAEASRSLSYSGRKAFPPQGNLSDYEPGLAWRAEFVKTDTGAKTLWLADEEGPISKDTLPAWSNDGERAYAVTRKNFLVANGPVELVVHDRHAGSDVRRSFAALHSAELAGDLFLAEKKMPDGIELPSVAAQNYAREPRVKLDELSAEQRAHLDLPPSDARKRPAAPAPNAQFDGFLGGSGIFHADTPAGTFLWSVAQGQTPRQLIATNLYAAAVTQPRYRAVPYVVEGAERTGLLYLPTGYDRRPHSLPLIVSAYPGRSPPRPTLSSANETYNWPLRYLLAQGFAVFVVDLRAYPEVGGGELTDRIMREMSPALAAAKTFAETDTRRWGYFGHSYGALTGLTLLSRSPDFTAGVIYAPVGDLTRYGLSARPEVADLPCSPGVTLDLQELQDADGFVSLAGPISEHVADYLRQSPISSIGQVKAPILMVRGEFDSFSGADELFAALAEKGIDTQLAVYRAEPHNLGSPDNMRDAARRISDWFKTRMPAS